MKIWIIGAEGLLGACLKELCNKRRLSFFATGKENGSVTCLETLKLKAEEHKPTHIVNCAAFTDVDGAEKLSKEAYAVNASGAENLGIIAREFGAKLVHISTDYVFSGSSQMTPFTEVDVCNPVGVYATSKWEGEVRLLAEFPQACVVRTSWIFGKRGKNFISVLFGKLKIQEVIKAVDDQLGRATFCYDLAEAILALLCHSGIFHFANEGELTRYQIALDMYKHAQMHRKEIACKEILPVKSTDFPAAAPRPIYSVLCTRKIEALLGCKPRSWQGALHEFLQAVE